MPYSASGDVAREDSLADSQKPDSRANQGFKPAALCILRSIYCNLRSKTAQSLQPFRLDIGKWKTWIKVF